MTHRLKLPSKEQLDRLLAYDPLTGALTWKVQRSGVRFWQEAGTIKRSGYRAIRVAGLAYQAHRLAWVIMTGEEPESDIDHINGVRTDNRWVNLRSATPLQNSANAARQRNNLTGYKGVGTLPHSPNRWQAQIKINGKNKYLGIYPSPELAHQAYMKAARETRGEFASDGVRTKPKSTQSI